MSKRHMPIFSIAMYALSVLLAVYAAWAFIHCWRDIADAAAAGQLSVRGNEFEIASFYMANSLQYDVWAALLFFFHRMEEHAERLTECLSAAAFGQPLGIAASSMPHT